MKTNQTLPQSFPQVKRAAIRRGQDASEKLLVALAIFALTASTLCIGILTEILVQTVPTINLVKNAQLR